MIIIGLLAAVVNHATNKKNLPESSSHYNYIDLIKKPSTIWLGAVPTTKPVLFYIALKMKKIDQGLSIATSQNCTDFYILKGGILQFIFIGAMSIFNAPRL